MYKSPYPEPPSDLKAIVKHDVNIALAEDIGPMDITAELLDDDQVTANIIVRENATLCGSDWFNETFTSLDSTVDIQWYFTDGQQINENDLVCKIVGNNKALLTGERTALNFLQLLSGTATTVAYCVNQIKAYQCALTDTRKTIPGLRMAQKYAVRCGGATNQRHGLYDMILIKENHINAAGSIKNAVARARKLFPDYSIEVEVENCEELRAAIAQNIDIIMLDNFDVEEIKQAVEIVTAYVHNNSLSRPNLEVSGNVDSDNIEQLAQSGIDYISSGALTKHVRAIDFSMLISD